VLTTVIGYGPYRVIVDGGNKSMGASALATITGHSLPVMRFAEEHGIFIAPPDAGLRVGEVVELLLGYAPGTVNWYDAYHIAEDERAVEIRPVIPRAPGHGGLLA
jgi:D-serine deaminase-like pyridoxal phosphate-dependent protein